MDSTAFSSGRGRRDLSLINAREVERLRPPAFLVEDFLEVGSLVMPFGQSGVGKSLFALDLAACVSKGLDWHGRKVRKGPVIYVAAEGVAGMGKRIKAWRRANHVRSLPDLWFLAGALNLMDDLEVEPFAHAVTAIQPVLIVVDTLARCMVGGDENYAKDMNKVVASCDEIRAATGAALLVIHHTGKEDTRGARGSNALYAACDRVISLKRKAGSRRITVHSEKAKEAADFDDFDLQLQPYGSSAVLRRAEESDRAREEPALDAGRLRVLEALPADGSYSHTKDWLRASKTSESTFHRHRSALVELGLVETMAGRRGPYRLTSEGTKLRTPTPSELPTD